MPNPTQSEIERAREFRHMYLLSVALASNTAKSGDVREACDLAEQAFLRALADTRERAQKAGYQIGYAAGRGGLEGE